MMMMMTKPEIWKFSLEIYCYIRRGCSSTHVEPEPPPPPPPSTQQRDIAHLATRYLEDNVKAWINPRIYAKVSELKREANVLCQDLTISGYRAVRRNNAPRFWHVFPRHVKRDISEVI
jgi:hypothetical protein